MSLTLSVSLSLSTYPYCPRRHCCWKRLELCRWIVGIFIKICAPLLSVRFRALYCGSVWLCVSVCVCVCVLWSRPAHGAVSGVLLLATPCRSVVITWKERTITAGGTGRHTHTHIHRKNKAYVTAVIS